MKKLIFDVSTEVMFIGLIEESQMIDSIVKVAKNDHAKYLIDRIDYLLKKNNATIDDVKEIIVGVGPGSYTGIRIAVMVAKMFWFSKNIHVKAVSSLLFMTSGYEGLVTAMIDARRGQVFSAVYENGKLFMEESLRLLEDLEKNEVYQKSEKVFITDKTFNINYKVINDHAYEVKDLHLLEPNYLRKTEAEMKNDQTSNN